MKIWTQKKIEFNIGHSGGDFHIQIAEFVMLCMVMIWKTLIYYRKIDVHLDVPTMAFVLKIS